MSGTLRPVHWLKVIVRVFFFEWEGGSADVGSMSSHIQDVCTAALRANSKSAGQLRHPSYLSRQTGALLTLSVCVCLIHSPSHLNGRQRRQNLWVGRAFVKEEQGLFLTVGRPLREILLNARTCKQRQSLEM